MAQKFSYSGATALVTGASSGIGAEIARQLARLGAKHIVLTARREQRLQTLQNELTGQYQGLKVQVYGHDLSKLEEVHTLADTLANEKVVVDCLINNAGLGDLGSFATSNWKRVEQMLMVNIIALTALTHRLLPGMLQQNRGAILNVGSTAGFLPLPTFAVYAATKAYVNNFTEALRIETLGRGVHVTALCPGPVDTEFGEKAERPNGTRRFRPPKIFYIPAARVVREGLQGLAKNRARVIPGKRLLVPMLAAEIAPRPLIRWSLALGTRINPL